MAVGKLDLDVDSGAIFGACMNVQYGLFIVHVLRAKLWIDEVISWPPERCIQKRNQNRFATGAAEQCFERKINFQINKRHVIHTVGDHLEDIVPWLFVNVSGQADLVELYLHVNFVAITRVFNTFDDLF